ncbi:hypothetical protein BCR41DRAFT_409744 [Lobosporangium transversale]|uniref:Uncharacterized protein n=1 Tax=Lobosporangium transversale TaxID=64571 RepID=A0A1Y2GZT2_9FUNG|nr:hypothetical protein BCR41DRAFT_409744 [Lobosporangium transversale]ORZ27820.1 hypothetical protein BCR41DRAFT_409744 [Lobosporangium transversale]|eukprot:XP_021885523.1 hypothetical protein BCR41DRAFT_409744 [Lobosporangium transversale]
MQFIKRAWELLAVVFTSMHPARILAHAHLRAVLSRAQSSFRNWLTFLSSSRTSSVQELKRMVNSEILLSNLVLEKVGIWNIAHRQ